MTTRLMTGIVKATSRHCPLAPPGCCAGAWDRGGPGRFLASSRRNYYPDDRYVV